MIHFVASKTYALIELPKATRERFHTIRPLRLRDYLDAPPAGSWIFAEPEALQTPFGQAFEHRLRRDSIRFLNTGRSLGRLALLNKLHTEGINSFNAYRVAPSGPWRYPVFVCSGSDGGLTGLLANENALGAALNADRMLSTPEKILVEYQDTSTDGVFRKYSVLKIGDRLIPHQLVFGSRWLLRTPAETSPEAAAEEAAFRAAPVPLAVARAFELAGIAYGRVDYSLLNGLPQIWGIHTNPVLAPAARRIHPLRRPSQAQTTALIEEAFARLDS